MSPPHSLSITLQSEPLPSRQLTRWFTRVHTAFPAYCSLPQLTTSAFVPHALFLPSYPVLPCPTSSHPALHWSGPPSDLSLPQLTTASLVPHVLCVPSYPCATPSYLCLPHPTPSHTGLSCQPSPSHRILPQRTTDSSVEAPASLPCPTHYCFILPHPTPSHTDDFAILPVVRPHPTSSYLIQSWILVPSPRSDLILPHLTTSSSRCSCRPTLSYRVIPHPTSANSPGVWCPATPSYHILPHQTTASSVPHKIVRPSSPGLPCPTNHSHPSMTDPFLQCSLLPSYLLFSCHPPMS